MSRIAGWVLLVAAVAGFFWAFKLLVDRPGSLVGILLFVPVWFVSIAGVKLVADAGRHQVKKPSDVHRQRIANE